MFGRRNSDVPPESERTSGGTVARSRTVRGLSDEARTLAEIEISDRAKRIEFYIAEYTIEILAQKMRSEEFVVPVYQRAFTWEPRRKSKFVESILMGLPIPFLLFWQMPDGRLEIVDGSQRLRTLEEWIYDGLKLGDLEELPTLSGSRFADLIESRQRKVKNQTIRGIILNEDADEQARFDMFNRINTGSKAANTAEVRRGALGGPFLNLVISLAKDDLFAQLAPVTEKADRERVREDLVTRFFAYTDGLEGYRDRPAEFLFNYARRKNAEFEADPGQAATYEARFARTLEFVRAYMPNGFKKTATTTTTARVRFEALAIGTHLAIRERPELAVDGPATPIADWIDSQEFTDIVSSDASNVQSKLVGRIAYVKDKLLA